MNRFILRRGFVIGYIIAFGIISFFAVFTYSQMKRAARESDQEEVILQSLHWVDNVFDHIQEMEANHREYIFSGNPSYQSLFDARRALIESDTLALKNVLSARSIPTDLVDLVRRKIEFMEETADLMNNRGPTYALARLRSDTSSQYMEAIRSEVFRIETMERDQLGVLSTQRKQTAKNTTILFFILTAFFIVFLVTYFIIERWYLRKRFSHEVAKQVDKNLVDFKDILERVEDVFIAVDKNWNYVFLNKKACEMIGRPQEEVLGKNIWKIFPDREREYRACMEAMETQKQVSLEIYYEDWDKWYETHIYPSKKGVSIYSKDITGKKRAEMKLKDINTKFEYASRATSDILWDYDIKSGILWMNDNYVEKFGMPHEKLTAVTLWLEHIHPEDQEKVAKSFDHLINSNNQTHWSEYYRLRKWDGTYLNIYDRCFLIRSQDGKPERLIGSMTDVTFLFEAKEELRKKEEQYRLLVEQATDGIFIADNNGKFQVVNSSGCKMSQFSREELERMTIFDLADPEELKTNPFRFEEMRTETGARVERKMKRKDGVLIDIEVNAKFLSDGRFLAFIRDITQRKKAEHDILKAMMLAEKLIDSLPGVFYFYDERGRFIRWNTQFEEVSGYSSEEITQMHPTDFYAPEDRAYIADRIKGVFEKGVNDAEVPFYTKDGKKVPYYFKAVRIMYEGKPCLLGNGIDISESKKAESSLQDSYTQIRSLTEHLQRIREEERAHIAREIHDELGQQLTVLKMDVSWLARHQDLQRPEIKEKLHSLTSLIDGTVNTVRRISSELRPSILDDLGLVAAIDWHLNQFETRSGIKTTLKEPVTDVVLSEDKKTGIFRIFQESLTNVARHAAAKTVTVDLSHSNGDIILKIIDDGKGFDKLRLGERRTLGILGMEERTTMMGGTYDIHSVPGKGTEVIVTIPVGNK